jgi:hypothetical protein
MKIAEGKKAIDEELNSKVPSCFDREVIFPYRSSCPS